MRFKIKVEYDGTCYSGWQKQEGELTIQSCLEEALYSMLHKKVEIFGSGRTDAGVHALGQVAHFDLETEVLPYKIMNGMNFYLRKQVVERANKLNSAFRKYCRENNQKFVDFLPNYKQDIVVHDCEIVDNEFDARFSAVERSYIYVIYNSFESSPILQNRSWQVQGKLDIDKMNEACKFLPGRKDFSSFRASACQAKSPIKTLNSCEFRRYNDKIIIFEIKAKSFLHHMVRNIVGTLKLVGTGKISVEEFKNILESRDRTKAGVTAPACGLFFKEVRY
jgi:tRNA pseudouridine38-40 synthase